MKIIHVIIGLGVGGAELMLKRLVEGLNGKDGMQHSIISLTELGPVGKQLQDAGISVKALGMNNAVNLPLTFFKLRRELKKLKLGVV